MNNPPDLLADIPPFYAMEMLKLAFELEKEGHKVCRLEVGQPIIPTPKAVIDEAQRMLREQPLTYCPALGLLELREAIVQHYFDFYGLRIDLSSVVITPGTSLGLYIALLMNFKKGANIAVASPSYPCYRNIISALGYTLTEITTSAEHNYLLTPELLAEYGKNLDGILIASPNNPTGSVYSAAELERLVLYCRQQGIRILSDELYHGITYEEKAQTILKFDQHAIVMNGFSKFFAMTGWRVGWMIVPSDDIDRYERLLQNMLLCTSTLTQAAAVKAFSAYAELNQQVITYKKNRDILYDALSNAGVAPPYKPQGAFYMYVELPRISLNSIDFCKKLLYEKHVAVAPGTDFVGPSKTCAIRLSFCQHQEVIEEAARRLEQLLR